MIDHGLGRWLLVRRKKSLRKRRNKAPKSGPIIYLISKPPPTRRFLALPPRESTDIQRNSLLRIAYLLKAVDWGGEFDGAYSLFPVTSLDSPRNPEEALIPERCLFFSRLAVLALFSRYILFLSLSLSLFFLYDCLAGIKHSFI